MRRAIINRFPVAKFNYLVKRFVQCTLTLEEAKKAAKNVIRQKRNDVMSGPHHWNTLSVATSFIWRETPEGQGYWSAIDKRLTGRL